MKKIIVSLLLLPALALAQSYPSPTYKSVTANGPGVAASIGGSTPVIGSPASFFYPVYFSNAGTGVITKANRLQVGVEALQSSDDPQTTTSWVSTLVPASMAIASIAATNQLGQLGIVGAARTSDYHTWTGGTSGGSEGLVGIGENDDTTASTNPIACGVCAEAVQRAGVGGSSINQLDAENYGSIVDVFPAGVFGSGGSTASVLLTPGAVATGLTNVSAAAAIGAGISAKFRKGILFLNSALDTSVGAAGGGVAMEMGLNQSLRWVNNSNATVAEIWGNASGFNMTPPLGVGSGGTGDTALTQFVVLLGNGTSGITGAAPSTAGGILTSNGASANPSFQTAINGVTVGATTASTGAFTTLSATSAITPSSTAGIVGTTLANNASAGSVGEYSTLTGGSVALSSGAATNLTSLSLTAGDWDVSGECQNSPAVGTTTTVEICSISTSSGVSGTLGQNVTYAISVPASTGETFATPTVRVSVGTTTTVFVVAQMTFAVSTMNGIGFIRARRVR